MSSAFGSYDFVIIGGGTAGLVLANRLSEDESQRILVLEAGNDYSEDPRVNIPALFETLKGTDADWGFHTEPQAALNGRIIPVNQGKALGGSGAINAHVFVPPAKGLIDGWQTLGNEGWNWDSFRKYFARSYSLPLVEPASGKLLAIEEWTARNDTAQGPLQTSFSGDLNHPIRRVWADTFEGRTMANDPFLNASVGSFSCLASIDPLTKTRSYATTAYYNPVKGRQNLVVLTQATVEKIILEKDNISKALKAVGVQFRHDNTVKVATVNKEAIIAAGALQSPKILELSGIGNPELLSRYGIPVLESLAAVGENLHDHAVSSISYKAVDDLDTLDALIRHEPEVVARAMEEYATHRTGPLTSVGVYTYALLPVPEDGRETLRQVLAQNRPVAPSSSSVDGPGQARARAIYDLAEKLLLDSSEPSGAYLSIQGQKRGRNEPGKPAPGPSPGKYLTIGAMLSHPLSRGSVHIQSSDPSVGPVVDPKYLSNPVDLEVLARHLLHVETIAASSPMATLLLQPLQRLDPLSHLTDLDGAKKYARESTISMWHLCGSCPMLPREKGGVVDALLRVYGTDNVRVVDASAFPSISTANTQATVYAFAERAADLVKEAWGLK